MGKNVFLGDFLRGSHWKSPPVIWVEDIERARGVIPRGTVKTRHYRTVVRYATYSSKNY
jgi:hypothetical protein